MNFLHKNIGATDRKLRIGVGAVLILLSLLGLIGLWGCIGIIPLLTGFMSTCPVYTVLKKNTLGK